MIKYFTGSEYTLISNNDTYLEVLKYDSTLLDKEK